MLDRVANLLPVDAADWRHVSFHRQLGCCDGTAAHWVMHPDSPSWIAKIKGFDRDGSGELGD